MGTLRRLFSERAISPATLFGTGADLIMAGRNDAGVKVDQETALTYSGVWAAMRLLAGDISTFPLDAFVKDGGVRRPLRPKPTWIEEPDPFDPSITRIVHFAQAAVSILGDGNIFTLAEPDVFNPVSLTVLNPLRVDVKKPGRSPEYRLMDRRGQTIGDVLTPTNIIHVKFMTRPGSERGMSPVEANGGNIAIAIAARKYVERFFGDGAQVPGFVKLPVDAQQTQVDEVAKKLKERHGGWRRAGLIGVLGGGADYVQTGIKPTDADLRSIFRYTLETAAQMYGIPPFMIGSQEPSGIAYASSVERAQHYIDHCLRHYTEPIEVAYRRLVPGDTTYLKFNYDALLRGDTKSRFEAHGIALDKRWATKNDIRRLEDMPPLPDPEGGFLDTPNNRAPNPTIIDLGTLVRAGFEPEAATAFLGLPPIKHTGLVPVTVQGENVATNGSTAP